MASILAATCSLGLGGVIVSAPASAAPAATNVTASPMTTTGMWRYYYYREWFYSEEKCIAWGKQITDPNSSNYIPGFSAYYCFRDPGDAKWSMNIFET
jgi:hypothetical protein